MKAKALTNEMLFKKAAKLNQMKALPTPIKLYLGLYVATFVIANSSNYFFTFSVLCQNN